MFMRRCVEHDPQTEWGSRRADSPIRSLSRTAAEREPAAVLTRNGLRTGLSARHPTQIVPSIFHLQYSPFTTPYSFPSSFPSFPSVELWLNPAAAHYTSPPPPAA